MKHGGIYEHTLNVNRECLNLMCPPIIVAFITISSSFLSDLFIHVQRPKWF